MQTFILGFIVIPLSLTSIGLALILLIREVLWRKKERRLKKGFEKENTSTHEQISDLENRLDAMEIEYLIKAMFLEGVEDLLAQGWTLVYSHSVGICAKHANLAHCVPLEEAILKHLYKEPVCPKK